MVDDDVRVDVGAAYNVCWDVLDAVVGHHLAWVGLTRLLGSVSRDLTLGQLLDGRLVVDDLRLGVVHRSSRLRLAHVLLVVMGLGLESLLLLLESLGQGRVSVERVL